MDIELHALRYDEVILKWDLKFEKVRHTQDIAEILCELEHVQQEIQSATFQYVMDRILDLIESFLEKDFIEVDEADLARFMSQLPEGESVLYIGLSENNKIHMEILGIVIHDPDEFTQEGVELAKICIDNQLVHLT